MSGGAAEPGGSADTRRVTRFVALVLAVGSIPFLVLEARLIRSRGPITLQPPATVLSNSHPGQRGAVPMLLFFRDLRPRLPPAASVALIGPHAHEDAWPLDDLVAIGQLPRNDVMSILVVVERKLPPPQFLAVELEGFTDDRYRLVAVLEHGRLYELKR